MRSRKVNKRKPEKNAEFTAVDLKARLDAIVLLLLGLRFSDEKGVVRLGPSAKLLHKAGYKPTEIAGLFGKKKATEISQYLY